MAKRFRDTRIWNKEWYLKLSIKGKLLVDFLFDNCDCAGIYEPNYTLLSFYIGEPVTEEDFKELKQIKKLENGNYFIEDFIDFQYNVSISDLNPKFSVHKGIIKQLEKNNITLNKPFGNPHIEVEQPLQDMDMDKDMYMDKIKDPYVNPIKSFFVEEYEKVFKTKPMLSNSECNRIVELAANNSDIRELIPIAIARLKCIRFEDIGFKPAANWLLRDNNFERVINGEFGKKTPFKKIEPEPLKPPDFEIATPEQVRAIGEKHGIHRRPTNDNI